MAATCLQETAQFIAIGKDIILGLAAITTAGVAVYGVRSWKRELTGKTEFEAANRMLQALYKVRDNFFAVRSRYISGGEFPPEYYQTQQRDNQLEGQAHAHIFKNRWVYLGKELQEFDSCAFEAEALWGPEFKSLVVQIRQCVRELQTSMDVLVQDYIDNCNGEKEFIKKMRSNVFASPPYDDELSVAFNAAVKAIEDQLRPHFKR